MIEIKTPDDVKKIKDKNIREYVSDFVSDILETNSPNTSLENVGTVFFLEDNSDIEKIAEMGINVPKTVDRYDLIGEVEKDFINACLVINNDFAINIIGQKEFFERGENNGNKKCF